LGLVSTRCRAYCIGLKQEKETVSFDVSVCFIGFIGSIGSDRFNKPMKPI
jgi:hypothetical protein